MKTRPLGTSGIETSVIGLGTWVLGGDDCWGANPDDAEAVRTIQASLDAGINLIDTAPAYGFGHSEEVVGKAIQGRREQAVIATKCGLWWDGERGSFFCEYSGKPMYRCVEAVSIQEEVERSLERLGVDAIDLYQVHWPAIPPRKTPIEETMGCLMALKDQGKIRAIGVSNVSLEEMKEYNLYGVVDTNQPRYSMLYRGIEEEILPYCAAHQISTLAYMPLEQGLLTGKVGVDRKFKENEFRSNPDWNPWFTRENRQRILTMLQGWSDLLETYQCTVAQLAIAWTISQPGVTHALCGARRVEQTLENAKAGTIELRKEDIARIRRDAESLGTP
ncbi:MAG: aldo/keto reductase [bacterium]|nr:aldo/keto reductase [bacterium]